MNNFASLSIIVVAIAAEVCVEKLEWSTANGQVLVNGIPLVLKGINYHGFETEHFAPLGLMHHDLDNILDVIKKNNFNAIQIPFSLEMVRFNPFAKNIRCDFNPGLCGTTSTRMLDTLINRAAERGLLVVLSNNQFVGNGTALPPSLWYDSQYPEELVIDIWKTLIGRYRNQWNVFAIDLKNEPHSSATWGNSERKTDWNRAAERIINGLSAFSGLFFVDGINWGNDLAGAAEFPISNLYTSLNNRVVYTPHCYGPQVYYQPEIREKYNETDFPNNLEPLYMRRFGFLAKKGLPVIIGEWAGSTTPYSMDDKWKFWIIDWLRKHCITNFIYWSLDPKSQYTVGLFEDDWITPNARKLELLDRLQPNPTKFEARNGKICITKGTFPERHCRFPHEGDEKPGTQEEVTSTPDKEQEAVSSSDHK